MNSETPPVVSPPGKPSFWRKLGGGSLSISLIVHGIILAVGIIWVVQVLPKKEEPEWTISRPGGSSESASSATTELKNKKRSASLQSAAPRIAAVGAETRLALMEPDPSVQMASLGPLTEPDIGGQKTGDPYRCCFPIGVLKPKMNLPDGPGIFGSLKPNENALTGVLYDFKLDPKRKPTNLTDNDVREAIKDFTSRGWNERALAGKYFQATQKLYQTHVYIPVMSADAAPKAFRCEEQVQPSRWMVIYRGNVTPPKTGKYRFAGAGDDVLVVRFNHKHVFDHGFTSGTTGVNLASFLPVLRGVATDKDIERKLRRSYPMELPVTFLQYDTTRNWNNAIGGLAVGPEFEANAGTSYPIEILISEIPGGLFCASLMIEEIGANYRKTSSGSPILPLFRLDSGQPAPTKADNAPPYDIDGPAWKMTGHADMDF